MEIKYCSTCGKYYNETICPNCSSWNKNQKKNEEELQRLLNSNRYKHNVTILVLPKDLELIDPKTQRNIDTTLSNLLNPKEPQYKKAAREVLKEVFGE